MFIVLIPFSPIPELLGRRHRKYVVAWVRNSGQGAPVPLQGGAGAGSGSEVTRETVARGGEVTSQEPALPQPTCPRDLKVRSVLDCQFRGRAHRARTRDAETPPGLCVGQRRVPSPQPSAGAEMPPVASRRPGLSPGQAAAAFRLLALLLLLSYCARGCRGKPALSPLPNLSGFWRPGSPGSRPWWQALAASGAGANDPAGAHSPAGWNPQARLAVSQQAGDSLGLMETCRAPSD